MAAPQIIPYDQWQTAHGGPVAPKVQPAQPTQNTPSAAKYFLPALGETVGGVLGNFLHPSRFVNSFYNSAKSGQKTLQNIVPGGKIATQLGQAPIQGQQVTQANNLTNSVNQLTNYVTQKLNEPGITPSQRQTYHNILKGNIAILQGNKNIEQNVSSGITGGQIAGDAASLVLLAAASYNPALNGLVKSGTLASSDAIKAANTLKKVVEATEAANRAQKLGKAGEVINAALKYGKPALQDLALNEGILTASGVASGKKLSQAAQESLGPSALLAAVPPAASVAIAGLAKGAELTGKGIGSGLEKAATKLERVAAGTSAAEKEAAANSVTEQVLARSEAADKTIGQRIAGRAAGYIRDVQNIPQRYVDRFAPLFNIQKRIAEVTGAPVSEGLKVGRNARLASDAAINTSEADLRALFGQSGRGGALSPYNDIARQVQAREHILDQIDRVNLGQSVPGYKVTDSTKEAVLKQLNSQLLAHQAELGPNEARLQQALKIRADYNRSLLDKAYRAGFISKDSYDRIVATHPNYIPHNVVQDVAENAGQFGASGSMNPKQAILKAEGSARQLETTDQAIIDRTAIVNRAVENNNVVGGVVQAQEKYGIVPGMRRVGVNGQEAKRGESVISFFRNGVKEQWVVPNDVAVAIKNLDAQTIPTALKWITAPQRLLKRFATKYNLSFSIPNLARDRQEAAVSAKAFIESLAQSAGAESKVVNLSDKEIRDLYMRSGGYGGSSILNEGKNEALAKLRQRGLVREFASSVNPARVIEGINQKIELSTREAVFRQALERGLSPKDAAFASREATVDFSKMGTHMRVLNELVPFLNARLQGTINAGRAAAAAPEVFARRLYWTAVLPQIGLYDWNRQFKSSQNIPQYIRDNYWVLVVGEVQGRDSNGNPAILPKMITIKKGQVQQLIANPVEYFLAKNDKNDPRTATQMITDVLGSASPVAGSSGVGYSNLWLSLISQAGPLANIAVGLGANVDPYRGNTIVPQDRLQASPGNRTSPYDPAYLKAIGKKFNISPAQLDFAINSLGGGATDISTVIDIASQLAKGKIPNLNPNEPSAFGQATRAPVSSKVLREASPQQNPNYQANLKKKTQLNQGVQDARLAVKDAATALDQKLLSMKTGQERIAYLNSLGNLVTPDVKKQLKAITSARTTAGILKTTDSTELRARYINMRLHDLSLSGLSQSQLTDYLNELEAEKILTSSVKRRIVQLKQTGQ